MHDVFGLNYIYLFLTFGALATLYYIGISETNVI